MTYSDRYADFMRTAREVLGEMNADEDFVSKFETDVTEKLKSEQGVRFYYSANFLQQIGKTCDFKPDGWPDLGNILNPSDKDTSNNQRKGGRGKKPSLKPAEPLVRSENAWVPTHERTSDEKDNVKTLRAISGKLNKMTEDNHERMIDSIIEELTGDLVPEFVVTIFNKAVWDDSFRHMYATLCVKLMKKFGPAKFGKPLLSQCQVEFKTPRPTKPDTADADELQEYEYEAAKWKGRRLGGLQFIVELLKVKIVTPKVIEICLDYLLSHDPSHPIAEDVQHACELASMCNGKLGKQEAQIYVKFAKRIYAFRASQNLAPREKFKIQDTLKLCYGPA